MYVNFITAHVHKHEASRLFEAMKAISRSMNNSSAITIARHNSSVETIRQETRNMCYEKSDLKNVWTWKKEDYWDEKFATLFELLNYGYAALYII